MTFLQQVVVRVDSGSRIGSGHVVRCLVLARALRERGSDVHFVCRAHAGHLGAMIEAEGFRCTLLDAPAQWASGEGDRTPAHAAWLGASAGDDARDTMAALGENGCDLLVVDHYGIDAHWEAMLRSSARRLFVIDDLADRQHDCDALLDQNFGADRPGRYDELIPATARRFLGPRWALLGESVRAASSLSPPAAPPRQVLVFFGAMDVAGLLPRTLAAIDELSDLPARFLLVGPGGGSGNAPPLPGNVEWLPLVPDFASRMARAHLALGAPGSATLERMYLGVPALLVTCADNQREVGDLLARAGLACLVGEAADMTPRILATALRKALVDPEAMSAIGERGRAIGVGADTGALLDFLAGNGLWPVRDQDLPLVLAWRNRPEVRRNMFTTHEITPAEHEAWWLRVRKDPAVRLFLFVEHGVAAGVVAFSRIDRAMGVAEWAFYSGPDARPGIGRRMERAALEYAFGELHLQCLRCEVLSSNLRVVRLHEKFGFHVDRVLPRQHERAEGWLDVYQLSMSAADWHGGLADRARALGAASGET